MKVFFQNTKTDFAEVSACGVFIPRTIRMYMHTILFLGLMDLDSSLGAYPYESLKKWVSLSNYVTEEIVST